MKVHFLFKKETREENLPDLLGADRSFSLFCSTKQIEDSLLSTITRMKHLIHLLSLHFLFLLCSCSTSEKEYYLFTSFHEPANAGLRYLYSEDGIHWDSIAGTWLKPELGANIMRDPSIWRDKDGTLGLDHCMEKRPRLWICQFQRFNQLVGRKKNSCNGPYSGNI